jgi:putative YphP/YqiW family bacilliredoxin
VLADVVESADVRVVQRRGDPRLPPEPIERFGVGRELVGQELQRDLTPKPRVFGAINNAHAAGAEPFEDAIVADDGANHPAENCTAYNGDMPYPEFFVAPMRQELLDLGVRELRTAADVDAAVAATPGTLLVVVNSVCGCAAGKARPGLALALRGGARPDALASVFAGFDVQATERARHYFAGYPPSSPSMGLFRDGKLVFMLERSAIENRDALSIAQALTSAFEQHCVTSPQPR